MKSVFFMLLLFSTLFVSNKLFANDTNVSSYSRESIEDAQSFITSRLRQQSLGKLDLWLPTNIQLGAGEWTWKEVRVGTDQKVLVSETSEFKLNPAKLVWPVQIKDNKLIFECQISACFSLKKSKLIKAIYTGENIIDSETEEKEAKHIWYFDDSEESKRVAKAMDHLLKAIGAPRRKY
jgi:hypothetical protein